MCIRDSNLTNNCNLTNYFNQINNCDTDTDSDNDCDYDISNNDISNNDTSNNCIYTNYNKIIEKINKKNLKNSKRIKKYINITGNTLNQIFEQINLIKNDFDKLPICLNKPLSHHSHPPHHSHYSNHSDHSGHSDHYDHSDHSDHSDHNLYDNCNSKLLNDLNHSHHQKKIKHKIYNNHICKKSDLIKINELIENLNNKTTENSTKITKCIHSTEKALKKMFEKIDSIKNEFDDFKKSSKNYDSEIELLNIKVSNSDHKLKKIIKFLKLD